MPELKSLLETSDDEGVRRQARGALEALGVVLETASATAPLWKKLSRTAVQSTRHSTMAAATGW